MTKKAIVIMPDFFNYANNITTELRNRGYDVFLYFEQPKRIKYLFIKNLSRIFHSNLLYRLFNKSLYNKVSKDFSDQKADLFLVIRGNILLPEYIINIKKAFLSSNALSIYYAWDSFSNMNHQGKIGDLFDKKFTFDSVDAYNHRESGWVLLPLFFTNVYSNHSFCSKNVTNYDLCCYGSFSIERYRLINKIKMNNSNLRILGKLYLDKKLLFFKRIMDSEYRNLDMSIITNKQFSELDIIDMVNECKAVLDIASSSQTGLTMRTIETLALGKKLVTNNNHITEYDFYDMNSVFILDNNNLNIPYAWFNEEFNVDNNVIHQYSLECWISKLLN